MACFCIAYNPLYIIISRIGGFVKKKFSRIAWNRMNPQIRLVKRGGEICDRPAPRPGRASLVLDVMEEYRAWVVDRNIIKLRHMLDGSTSLDKKIKQSISDAIDSTMESRVLWKGKNLRLDNIIQRQAYRLAGAVCDDKSYRGMRFKW